MHSVQLPELGAEVQSSFEHWMTPESTIRDIVSWSYFGHILVIFWLGYVGELVSPPNVQKSFNPRQQAVAVFSAQATCSGVGKCVGI